MLGSLSSRAEPGEGVLGHVLPRGGEEGFEWGRLQAGALGPFATRGLISGQGSPGNPASPLLSCGTIA